MSTDEHKLKIRDFFNENWHFWSKNKRLSIRNDYLSLLGDLGKKKILDMGCGLGIDASILSERGANGLGIDISKKSIEQCEINKINNWRFIVGDTEEFNINEKFDYIISSMEIMYHKNLGTTLKNYIKFMNNEGSILLVTNNPYYISIKHKIDYHREKSYKQAFAEEKHQILKFNRPIQNYIDIFEENNIYLRRFKEIYCNNNDCKKFDESNNYLMPEFFAFLFSLA